EVAVSPDNERFESVLRRKEKSPVRLVLDLGGRVARYVRITSHDSANPTYPTTFFEVEVNGPNLSQTRLTSPVIHCHERGVRALGVIGGPEATGVICRFLGESPPSTPAARPMVSAAIRSLGRLKDERGFDYLVQLLDDPMWARRAAESLGDFGDERAVPHLLAAYTRYAKRLDGSDPPEVPLDDKMSFPSEDRMLETPYCIILALSRFNLDDARTIAALREVAPLLLANQPGDHDTFFLYEPEPAHRLTRHVLETCGLREEAVEHAFELLGQGKKEASQAARRQWPAFPPYRAASWLPTLCTERSDLPRLLALLEHDEGWVRLNAAKAIAWLGDPEAIEPLARTLAETPPEAEFGYSGTFKDEEYADPAPRWREGLIRALGLLGGHEHTQLIVRILDDERSVLEVRRAAADALADLGNDQALAALRRAASEHPFFSIRHVARDALRAAGIAWDAQDSEIAKESPPSFRSHSVGQTAAPTPSALSERAGMLPRNRPSAIVFLKGSNNIPNTMGTVEQADRWRQTYVVTDSGPAYRPARNLYLLSPVRPDGKVTPVTKFTDGYVAEPELSWEGDHVLFCRRGEDDPWWHLWRVDLDGGNLQQLTEGPYHHVGPLYLADGRIACASSRLGIRDEYHGYPCTGLVVMNPDGTDIQPIATNIGRDNEPALLPDGRLAFSRLEVFYSRNKTELTLHAAHVDGTQDVVLYGPERRPFWRDLDHGPRTPADGQEAPLTHRVLRMTQPQPMPNGDGVIVSTQGGLIVVGSQRDRETFVSPANKKRAYTTPFPLPDGRVLCASTLKTSDRQQVDLGIYVLDPKTKSLELVYNDPETADFEARPVLRRKPPPTMPDSTRPGAYSGRFLCSSVFDTQEAEVESRGRLVRLIEGVPMVARHSTQTNDWEVWKNHGGTLARVLGTVPLAADGSFFVQAPADRLLHFQVLDSNRRVLGNQLTWIYTRPGETKSCVGCHEPPHTTPSVNSSLASRFEPVKLVPRDGEFRYRAKAWFKGHLPPEIEERTRTVRAVNLLGR
ncbi:MAG: HEAT repeat domain-containing protein, partial [Planctomycetota bacterium]